MTPPSRIVIGISGASGELYGIRTLHPLQRAGVETHLVMTPSAELTLAYETTWKLREVHALATHVHKATDVGASIASGSFRTIGMLVAPCSIRSLSEIAYGQSTGLLARAADVMLKERRRLVLMVRETPLHLGHIRAMAAATEAGAIVAPPAPAFYGDPASIDDIVDHSVGRCLDLFGIEAGLVRRWGEPDDPSAAKRRRPRRRTGES